MPLKEKNRASHLYFSVHDTDALTTPIKEVTLQKEIHDFKNELSEAKKLVSKGYKSENKIKPIKFLKLNEG
jgi:hypothetical protein